MQPAAFRFRHGAAVLAIAALAVLPVAAPLSAQTVAVRAGRMIDGTGAAPVENVVILIEGERITQVGPQVQVPAEAQVIDLSDHTVMPGFLDMHTHLTGRIIGDGDWAYSAVLDEAADDAIRGVRHAAQTLEAGFTTVRNLGSGHHEDLDLRDAVTEGIVPGPRIFGAGQSFGITGGHCDNLGSYARGIFDEDENENAADGLEEVRKAVRRNVSYGADVIKICATGGVLSLKDSVGVQQYTEEEMRTIVETAEMLERKVAAHAHGNEGIKAAVRAGVASIEHASILDDEAIRLMKEHGTFVVPTLMAAEAVERMAPDLPPNVREKALYIAPIMRRSFRMAVENGVKIAFGTDAGVFAHGTNGHEFTLMVENGMTPMQAMVAATTSAAELLGMEGQVGVIAPGAFADLVGVRGDPLAEISLLESVDFVMKGGEVFKEDGEVVGRSWMGGS